MGHLSPEQLLDVAEGAVREGAVPHLAACERCQGELAELRRVIAAVQVDVPEPSPLFWEHFSARVRDAVTAEGMPRPRVAIVTRPWAAFYTAAAVVIAAVIVWNTAAPVRAPVPSVTVANPPQSGPRVAAAAAVPDAAADDASLAFVADVAADLDWDGMAAAGLSTNSGAVDRVLTDLSSDESVELQRLLRDALNGA